MGQSNLQIAISALNNATDEIQGLSAELKGLKDNTDAANASTKDANATNKDAKSGVGDLIQQVTGLNLAEISVGGAIVAGIEAMKASIDTTLELAGETRKLDTLTGMTAEQSSRLIAVTDDLGISQQTLVLGIQAAIKHGLEPNMQGLEQLGNQYKAIQDPIAQSKWLLTEFGRQGANLAPLFQASTDQLQALGDMAQRQGLVMSQDGVQAAKEFQIQVNELKDSFKGLEVEIGTAVLPALNSVVADMLPATNQVIAQKQQLDELGITYNTWRGEMIVASVDFQKYQAMNIYWTNQMASANFQLDSSLDSTNTFFNKGVTAAYDHKNAIEADQLAVDKLKSAADKLKSAENDLTASQDNLAGAQKNWTSGAGNDAVNALEKAGVKGKLLADAEGTIDTTMGTSLVNQANYNKALKDAADQYAKTHDLTVYNQALSDIKGTYEPLDQAIKDATTDIRLEQDAINNLQGRTIFIDTVHRDIYDPTHYTGTGSPSKPKPHVGPGGQQRGLDMIIPPGYQNDSYPLNVSSGEHVTVTNNYNLGVHTNNSPGVVNQSFNQMRLAHGG